MKKWTLTAAISLSTLIISACGNDGDTIKIGVSGSDTRIWDLVSQKAAEENIEIEIVSFSDYVQPNIALAENELDLNAFQTISYFDEFIEERELDLSPIGSTVLAPMALYSEKVESVEELPDGATIAVPNESTNLGRALLLLEEAGLITLDEDAGLTGTAANIVDNPKNIEILPVIAGQTPRSLPDVDASIINNGIAVDAGFSPVNDSIFRESDTATPYINIIASRTEDTDREDLQRIVELYQEDDVAEFIEEEYDGGMIPTFIPVDQLTDY
ncbi:MetQ/NlpA family ABC transporter substrate-binding protein [Jeotgalibacillus proteolyticus]|uniref:Lipoprotein n=1 Tax=Jeotgalibacillus proteolyticus TaxID=2082395 RepID=A0A2S5GCA0_9BACL|nr:MetQ/NlpA family ABC transporter substrate-binding protein [Jeotgalibacillus proteolyticus]PPA70578.1 methionine ABC transporter substrate-binding protein [Jeotgalibacillus proteolyticus]